MRIPTGNGCHFPALHIAYLPPGSMGRSLSRLRGPGLFRTAAEQALVLPARYDKEDTGLIPCLLLLPRGGIGGLPATDGPFRIGGGCCRGLSVPGKGRPWCL